MLIGSRPEHFEDATIAPEAPDQMRFRTKVDVVESMGSELYVYFDVAAQGVESAELNELAADAGMEDLPSHGGGQQIVARLSAESRATPGQEADLVLDLSRIKLFDHSGNSLTRR